MGGAENHLQFFFWNDPPAVAAGGNPQTPTPARGSWQGIDQPGAHSAGLLIIARGTCREARACIKYRVIPRHDARGLKIPRFVEISSAEFRSGNVMVLQMHAWFPQQITTNL
jgi:hypothetical protein